MKINRLWAYRAEQWENIIRIIKIRFACIFFPKHSFASLNWKQAEPSLNNGVKSSQDSKRMCQETLIGWENQKQINVDFPSLTLSFPWRIPKGVYESINCKDPRECSNEIVMVSLLIPPASPHSTHIFSRILVMAVQASSMRASSGKGSAPILQMGTPCRTLTRLAPRLHGSPVTKTPFRLCSLWS